MSDPAILNVRLDPQAPAGEGPTTLLVLGCGGPIPQPGDSVERRDTPGGDRRTVVSVGAFGREHGRFVVTIDAPFGAPRYGAPALTTESALDLHLIPA